jgi:ribosomal protein L37AE/L43A
MKQSPNALKRAILDVKYDQCHSCGSRLFERISADTYTLKDCNLINGKIERRPHCSGGGDKYNNIFSSGSKLVRTVILRCQECHTEYKNPAAKEAT